MRKVMEDWQCLLKKSITNVDELAKYFKVDVSAIDEVLQKYPMRINPYYLSLIKEKDDAIWRQAVPDIKEIQDTDGIVDPLNEEADSPVSNLTHRYPDRVLLLVSEECATYCRFCTRKRKVGSAHFVSKETIEAGIDYIKTHSEIRDVILSGGDPLLLTDKKIESILKSIRAIPHVEIIRIGTRVPCTLPQRITVKLCRMLKKYHPLYINTHFNHPDEITPESKLACERLADSGIPLGNQTVLLRGVNDDPEIMKRLMQKLLTIRVKPYYLFQADLVKGTSHFRTSVKRGLEIIHSLRGFTSGLCVPHYVIDTPLGGGKIALLPDPIVDFNSKEVILRNYKGEIYKYPSRTMGLYNSASECEVL